MTPKEVLALCREKDVKAVDLRFCDLFGKWQHTTIPVSSFNEDAFTDGIGFDGSSIRGWQSIEESDLVMIPKEETAFLDPFAELTTLNIVCEVMDPLALDSYALDPRYVARQAMSYLHQTGVADEAFFGPEAEFYIFDDVRFDQTSNSGFYSVDSNEAQWNRGREEYPNLGHKIGHQAGYMPVPPNDQLMDIRNEMMHVLIDCGIEVESQHHEVGMAGQAEIDIKYNSLLQTADNLMVYKYVTKNVARRHNKSVTFMPKPIYGDNGSGMHVHFSLWKDQRPLFAGAEYAGLSDMALHAIGGIIAHSSAIAAFANPTTNSYKRLVPGFEAPVHLTYSKRNRSAACRIPMYSSDPNTKRVEVRYPDATSNPYLAFSAILLAAIDGIQNKIDPGEPLDQNLYTMDAEQAASIPKTPTCLGAALTALEKDFGFLLKGDVFSEELIHTWIRLKRKEEVEAVNVRPHPYEFCLYYDV